MKAKFIALLGLLVAASGCMTYRVADLTLVSDNNVSGLGTPLAGAVQAEDCRFAAGGWPSIDEAVRKAQDQVPAGNALTDVSISMRQELYILATRNCFIVRGKPVSVTGQAPAGPVSQ